MIQSRSMSMFEAATNVALGWLVAVTTQLIVFPVVGLQASLAQNLGISLAFTAVSFVRSYLLRRLFERLGVSRAPAWGGGMNLHGFFRRDRRWGAIFHVREIGRGVSPVPRVPNALVPLAIAACLPAKRRKITRPTLPISRP